MPSTDAFVRKVKYRDSEVRRKHAGGGGMYLLIKPQGKYWRMDYAFAGKRRTLALSVYPAVTLAKARRGRQHAKQLLADGVDPAAVKRAARVARVAASSNSFELVSREFHSNKSVGWKVWRAVDREDGEGSLPANRHFPIEGHLRADAVVDIAAHRRSARTGSLERVAVMRDGRWASRIGLACLLKRVFEIDMEHCPNCSGELKIIAAILEASVLEHLGLPERAPPRSAARAPDIASDLIQPDALPQFRRPSTMTCRAGESRTAFGVFQPAFASAIARVNRRTTRDNRRLSTGSMPRLQPRCRHQLTNSACRPPWRSRLNLRSA
jgi:hypothetical protein